MIWFLRPSCRARRIREALGIIHLVEGRRTFGAVAAPAPRVSGIAFELLHPHLVLVDVGQQSAGRLAVEADGRDQGVMLLDFLGPLRGIVFGPIIPTIGWGIAGESSGGLVKI